MLTPLAAAVFLPFAAAIGLWVAWSDMASMRIPNKAVLALWLVWAFPGLLIVPLKFWLLGWALAFAVLAAGFLANLVGLLGAGDAKFASAMAPFFIGTDIRVIMGLLAACLLGAFAAHRLARAIPALRRVAPGWESWTHDDFPMGLALSGMLVLTLAGLLATGIAAPG
jgi:prepilin peptidase CpaA